MGEVRGKLRKLGKRPIKNPYQKHLASGGGTAWTLAMGEVLLVEQLSTYFRAAL